MNPVLSIDVSKSTSFAAAFLSNSNPYSKPFKFSHSPSGLSNLLSILSEMESLSGLAPSVVLEATGNYSKPISTYFFNHGYDVVVLNPLQTHELKKKTLRKVKTDPIDANRIAKVFYMGIFSPITLPDVNISELRDACRQYESFNILYTESLLKLRNILDLVFPNYDKLFSSVANKVSLRFLSNYKTPDDVLNADFDELVSILKVNGKTRDWSIDKANLIIEAAKESLPAYSSQQSNIRAMTHYIDLILHQKKILTDIRDQINSFAKLSSHYELLLSIPGVGELTASSILAEIGDISNFPSSKQLTAFAGLDPSVYQSGNFRASNNKISKRGSTHLRKALYQSASASICRRTSGYANPTLRDFYVKKIAEGKPSKVAIVATSNKLLRIIYGVLKSGKPFELR